MDIKDLFIAASVAASFIASVPYVLNILKRKTRPKLVTWLNWTALSFITGSASLSDHQYAAAINSYAASINCLTIAILGFRYGSRKYDLLDLIVQAGVIVSLILWWIFNSPAVAIIAVIVIDFIALVPTLRHAWVSPKEETWQLFILSGLASIFTILAARSIRITSVASPIYIAIIDISTSGIIFWRQKSE